jgi:hypothetical protein
LILSSTIVLTRVVIELANVLRRFTSFTNHIKQNKTNLQKPDHWAHHRGWWARTQHQQPTQIAHCSPPKARTAPAPWQHHHEGGKVTLKQARQTPLSLPQSHLSPTEPARTALQQWRVRGRHAQPFGAGQRRLPPTGDTPVGQQILPNGKHSRGESCGSSLQGCVRYLSLESWMSGATLRGSCSTIRRKTTLPIFTVILMKWRFRGPRAG